MFFFFYLYYYANTVNVSTLWSDDTFFNLLLHRQTVIYQYNLNHMYSKAYKSCPQNNLSECITLGDSSLACQTRVSFGHSGLVAASRAHQVSLASKVIKPASACTCRHPGENTGCTNNKIYRAHTRGDPACGAFNHVISLPEESIKKPGEPRVHSTACEFDSNRQIDQRTDKCYTILLPSTRISVL